MKKIIFITALLMSGLKTFAQYVPPIAGFIANPETVCQGNNITFTDTSMTGTYPIVEYKWTFNGSSTNLYVGGSSTGTPINPSPITFFNLGSNLVTLKVMDSIGIINTITMYILVVANPTITITPPLNMFGTSICQGDSLCAIGTVTNGNYPITWVWTQNSTDTVNLDSTFCITQSGSYQITATNNNGCISNTYGTNYINTQEPVDADIQYMGNSAPAILTICQNLLPASLYCQTLGPSNQFLWSNGTMSSWTDITSGGTYSVIATSWNNVCPNDTDAITIVVVPNPNFTITIDEDSLCVGDVAVLSVPSGCTTYTWWSPTGPIGGNAPSVQVTTSGTYYVNVTDSNGCSNISQISTNVIFEPLPTQPSIIPGDNDCIFGSSSGAFLRQWYMLYPGSSTNMLLPSETYQYINITQPNFYLIEITDNNGCKNISDPEWSDCDKTLSVEDLLLLQKMKVYPNPFSNNFSIDLSKGEWMMVITNALGQEIYRGIASQNFSFQRNNIPAGIYNVLAQQGEHHKNFRVVAE